MAPGTISTGLNQPQFNPFDQVHIESQRLASAYLNTDLQQRIAMATDQSFVDYLCEQSGLGGHLSYRKMFGEYALYLDKKVIAFVCDNHLYVKPTPEGRQVLGTVSEHPPYPGGKPHFRIGDEIDDRDLLQRLFRTTAHALPMPKPKAAKKPAKAP